MDLGRLAGQSESNRDIELNLLWISLCKHLLLTHSMTDQDHVCRPSDCYQDNYGGYWILCSLQQL